MNTLIIGGSTGIGAAIIQQLNAAGHRTISINRSGITEANECHACDVLNDDLPPLSTPISSIIYLPGSINLKPFRSLKQEDFQNDFNINFFGAVRVIQKYQSQLTESSSPSIVLFSTVAVQTGMAFHASVAAAKGAVEGLTRSLAAEFAPKIRVNCIAPSLTDTPLASRLTDSETKVNAAAERHPLKKIGRPQDVASLAVWLASDQSQFVTGQIFKMDGGMSSIK
jgi:NAD(P)-dependent dehydrogenase (short-subunit alcohol dehydrogenase family)